MSADKIAALNDALRRNPFRSGRNKVLVAGSLAQEPMHVHLRVLMAASRFDHFDEDNDPYQERDCFVFELDGRKYLWKCDYYDPSLTYHSEDPSNEEVTIRVATVMYASDY
ncbi:DUF3768 domain-containing protein [Paracoccus sp. (in: a-proteobacteria)]|uniref:DUF3768 domain-containing protein n=1 Tax=Paracoccus sp. TaxID=267 RepID=UPI0040594771